MKVDVAIVGAGLTGCTIAERFKSRGKNVHVFDSRDRVGGTSADKIDNNGMLAPLYGPHAFHTNSDRVWEYLSSFTRFIPYEQKSLTFHKDEFYQIPINASTIEKFFDRSFEFASEVQRYLDDIRDVKRQVKNSYDFAIAAMGEKLYAAFYEEYTFKQWGCYADRLHRSVLGRIPIRTNRDPRYFTDKHQGLPAFGYTDMMLMMLGDAYITLNKKVTLKEMQDYAPIVIWTGPLDEAFEYCFGPLEWRSLRWEIQNAIRPSIAAVVHYPDMDVPWTRVTDVSYFDGFGKPNMDEPTNLHYEFSCDPGSDHEKFYPILRPEVSEVFENYLDASADVRRGTYFLGRMGRFKYINMDQAVSSALSFMDEHE
jgi:UDP-galactopyranose mutase